RKGGGGGTHRSVTTPSPSPSSLPPTPSPWASSAAALGARGAVGGRGEGEGLPGGVQEALQLLLSMRRRGIQPDEVTMNAMLDGLASCDPPRMREAEAMLEVMQGWGLKPNQVSYSVMLKGYGHSGDLTRAQLMFDLMARDRDYQPDVVALNSLLDACVRNGDTAQAVSLLELVRPITLLRLFSAHYYGPLLCPLLCPMSCTPNTPLPQACNATEPGNGPRTQASRQDWGWESPRARDGDGAPVVDEEGGQVGSEDWGWGAAAVRGLEISPNLVSFSTVVLALVRTGGSQGACKAMELYKRMREGFRIQPDEGMVDGILSGHSNHLRNGVTGAMTLEHGRLIIQDLETMGWDEEVIEAKKALLQSVMPTISEVWKTRESGEVSNKTTPASDPASPSPASSSSSQKQAVPNPKKKASAEIFEKYGWNKMDSHFPIL
ncbi:unnamed protein product, partial [Discosporangium mesarthrocarpum]